MFRVSRGRLGVDGIAAMKEQCGIGALIQERFSCARITTHWESFMMYFRARSSAKINLSLDILDRLPSGYHTLRSLVHPVGLWGELELEFRDD